MTCSKCGRDDNYSRRYCRECGQKISNDCPKCGFMNDITDKYCGGCGISTKEKIHNAQEVQTETTIQKKLRMFPQYDGNDLNLVIEQANKLRESIETPVTSTFQQDDIDKLFEI